MVEVTMAALLLMAAMALAVKLVVGVGLEQRSADRRLWSVQEVSNLSERIAAEPFDKVTVERARALAAEAKAEGVLPGAEWTAEVADAGGPPPAGKRVTLRLRWKDRGGDWVAPVRLTSWIYRGRDRS
jgi:hypothetical protein